MNKENLKGGNIVETRDGRKYIFNYVEGRSYFIRLTGAGFNPTKYYKNDLSIDDSNRESDIVKVYKNYTCQELLWERKEKPKLTEDERVILRNVPKGFKFITRNKNNYLKLHINRPIKIENCDNWQANGVAERFYFFNHLFQFIKWEDEEPYLIEDLLKEQEDDE